MQDLLIRQQDRRVHWRHGAQPHDQHITGLPAAILHLPESNVFSLLQEDAFACVKYWRTIEIRQYYALQREVISHKRKAVIDAVFPLAADQGLMVIHFLSGIDQIYHGRLV